MALAFTSHNTSLTRAFENTCALVDTPVQVTIAFTNHESADLHGFIFTEHIPDDLAVTTTAVRVSGIPVTNYIFETGLTDDVHEGCVPRRWTLELPPAFAETNPVPAGADVSIAYALSGTEAGSFGLDDYNWSASYTAGTNPAFGYSEEADGQDLILLNSNDIAATHQSSGYWSPGTNSIACQGTYPTNAQMLSLLWTPALPTGWTLGTCSGDGAPEVDGTNIVFVGDLTNNPLVFSYTLVVPSGEFGARTIAAEAQYQLHGMANPNTVMATPDPLSFSSMHSLQVTSLYGGADPPAGVHTYVYGSSLTCRVTNSPVSDGVGTQYVCVGWTGTGSAPADTGTTTTGPFAITNDSTLAWNWQTQYLLTASAEAHGHVNADNGWHDAGSNVIVSAVSTTGYHFAGWSGDVPVANTNDNPLTLVLDRARTVTAAFSINHYTIDATCGQDGTIVPTGSVLVAHDGNATFVISPHPHYHVADVLVDSMSIGATNSYGFLDVTTNHTIHADFAIDEHTLTVRSAQGGASPPAGTHVYPYGTALTCSVTNSPVQLTTTQAVCVGWVGAGSVPVSGDTTSTGSLVLTNDSDITWLWTSNYWFEATATVGGAVSASNGWYASGSTATALASSIKGFLFDAWSGEVDTGTESNNPVSVIMDIPRSISADFRVDTNTVYGSHDCPGYHSPGTQAVVSCRFVYPASQTLTGLVWSPVLPENWAPLSAQGDGAPEVLGTNIVFNGNLTNNPVTFSYRLNVPGNAPAESHVAGTAAFAFPDMEETASVRIAPDPLSIPRYHSADFQQPFWVIDATEINRVLAYWRAGGYYPNNAGYDGFAPTNSPDTENVDGARHSADYQEPYWVIDSVEVEDVLAYWRAGGYSPDTSGADGYALAVADDILPAESAAPPPGAADIQILQSGPPLYDPDGTVTITNIVSTSDPLYSLGWCVTPPAGWALLDVTGDASPEFRYGRIVLTGSVLESPVTVACTFRVPLWSCGDQETEGAAAFHMQGMANATSTNADPYPLVIAPRDSDADGMPDAWEDHYTGDATNLAPHADQDRDGMDNLDEHLAGTDPTNAASRLWIAGFREDTNGIFEISWHSVTARCYQVEVQTNVHTGFHVVVTNLCATPPTNALRGLNQTDGGAAFYRIAVP